VKAEAARALREKFQLSIVVDPLFGENCYLLHRRDTDRVIVLDPGLQHPEVLRLLEQRGWQVDRILLTHGHVDHVLGVPSVLAIGAAPVSMHPDDQQLLDFARFRSFPFTPPDFQPFEISEPLVDGALLGWQDVQLQVLHTPGHTEGSCVFLVGEDLFSGDTLFQRGIGRTDLEGGNFEKIVFSIKERLYALPGETVVYPGHGPKTTIREEKLMNPFVPAYR
jgi:glyoxylase-like metal-dependent hydrolase (beta-lactamase superfamily II)